MKQILSFLLCFSLTASAFADGTIVLKATTASQTEYSAFLLNNPDKKSYVTSLLEDSQRFSNELVSEIESAQVFYLKGDKLEAAKEFEKIFLKIQGQLMSTESAQLQIHALEKLAEISEDKNLWSQELRKAKALWGQAKWAKKTISFRPYDLYPQMNLVIINGKKFEYTRWSEIQLENSVYQIVFLSNSFKPVFYVGAPNQISKQTLTAVLSGNCLEPVTQQVPWEIVHQTQAFYSNNCVKTYENQTWITKNSQGQVWSETKTQDSEDNTISQQKLSVQEKPKWVLPALVAVGIGFLIYTLRDKKMVITKPAGL